MEPDMRSDPRAANDSRKTTSVQSDKEQIVEKKPSAGQRWRGVQPTKTILFWAILAAIVVTIAVGFIWGGWVTGGASIKAGELVGKDAVIERLAPICVAQFNQDPDNAGKLEELKGLSSYQRSQYVQDQGWATMPGEEKPDRKVAEACAKLLMEPTP
jgi:hypothetical protein